MGGVLIPYVLPIMIVILIIFCLLVGTAESPAFEVLPSLSRLKKRVMAASRGEYDAVFMSGR